VLLWGVGSRRRDERRRVALLIVGREDNREDNLL